MWVHQRSQNEKLLIGDGFGIHPKVIWGHFQVQNVKTSAGIALFCCLFLWVEGVWAPMQAHWWCLQILAKNYSIFESLTCQYICHTNFTRFWIKTMNVCVSWRLTFMLFLIEYVCCLHSIMLWLFVGSHNNEVLKESGILKTNFIKFSTTHQSLNSVHKICRSTTASCCCYQWLLFWQLQVLQIYSSQIYANQLAFDSLWDNFVVWKWFGPMTFVENHLAFTQRNHESLSEIMLLFCHGKMQGCHHARRRRAVLPSSQKFHLALTINFSITAWHKFCTWTE